MNNSNNEIFQAIVKKSNEFLAFHQEETDKRLATWTDASKIERVKALQAKRVEAVEEMVTAALNTDTKKLGFYESFCHDSNGAHTISTGFIDNMTAYFNK